MEDEAKAALQKFVSKTVEDELKPLKEEFKRNVDEQVKGLGEFEAKARRDLEAARLQVAQQIDKLKDFEVSARRDLEQRLRDMEDRVTRDVRTKAFGLALTVVLVAAGGTILGSITAAREVNTSVMNLQDRIIGAQTTIQNSQNELNAEKDQMAESKRQLANVTKDIADAKAQLNETTKQLETARAEYAGLVKSARAGQK